MIFIYKFKFNHYMLGVINKEIQITLFYANLYNSFLSSTTLCLESSSQKYNTDQETNVYVDQLTLLTLIMHPVDAQPLLISSVAMAYAR